MKHNQKVLWEGICEGLFVLYIKKIIINSLSHYLERWKPVFRKIYSFHTIQYLIDIIV